MWFMTGTIPVWILNIAAWEVAWFMRNVTGRKAISLMVFCNKQMLYTHAVNLGSHLNISQEADSFYFLPRVQKNNTWEACDAIRLWIMIPAAVFFLLLQIVFWVNLHCRTCACACWGFASVGLFIVCYCSTAQSLSICGM